MNDAFLVKKIVPENSSRELFSDDDKFRYEKKVETALNLITQKLIIR